jgi:hypothetical protein
MKYVVANRRTIDGVSVSVGQSLKVQLRDVDLLADKLGVRCVPSGVLICTAISRESSQDRSLDLHALRLRPQNFGRERVQVTLLGAHQDTYHPGFATINVDVSR